MSKIEKLIDQNKNLIGTKLRIGHDKQCEYQDESLGENEVTIKAIGVIHHTSNIAIIVDGTCCKPVLQSEISRIRKLFQNRELVWLEAKMATFQEWMSGVRYPDPLKRLSFVIL